MSEPTQQSRRSPSLPAALAYAWFGTALTWSLATMLAWSTMAALGRRTLGSTAAQKRSRTPARR